MSSPLAEFSRLLRSYLKESLQGRCQFLISANAKGVACPPGSDWFLEHQAPPLVWHWGISGGSFEPMDPFLAILRQHFTQPGPEALNKIFEAEEVYPPHRELFASWIFNGRAERHEQALFPEKTYEQRLILESLWKVLKGAFKYHVVVFFIDRIHQAPGSFLDFMTFIRQENLQHSFVFVLALKKEFEAPPGDLGTKWNRFWEVFEDCRVPSVGRQGDPLGGKSPRFSLKDFTLALDRVSSLMNFFCFQEAGELLTRLYALYLQSRANFTTEEACRLFLLLTQWSLWDEDPFKAFAHGSYALSLIQGKDLRHLQGHARVLLSYASFLQGDFGQALEFAQSALETFRGQKDKPGVFWALFFLLLAEENLKTLDFTLWRSLFREYLSLGQDLEFNNALSYFLANPYRMDSSEHISEATYFHDWGLALAEAGKNLYRMSDAYLQRGYFWSLKGQWESVVECYEKSEAIKKQIGHGEELPYVYNARGFFHLTVGDHVQAQKYFLFALEGLKNQRNFREIGMTMFNLGMNCLLSDQFGPGEQFFIRLLRLLQVLELEALVFHSRYEIFLHLAFSQIKQDKWVKAMETWTKAQEIRPQNMGVVEQLFTLIVDAWMRAQDHDWSGAQKAFSKVDDLIQSEKKVLRFYGPFCYLEAGLYFRFKNQEDWAYKMLKKGYLESFQLPNGILRQKLQALLTPGSPVPPGEKLDSPGLDFDWIIEAARFQKSFLDLQKQKVELELLKRFQGILHQSRDPQELVDETMHLFQKVFFFDAGFLFIKKDDRWLQVYSSISPLITSFEGIDTILSPLRSQGEFYKIMDLSRNEITQGKNFPFSCLLSFTSSFQGQFAGHLILASNSKVEFSPADQDMILTSLGFLVAGLSRLEQEIQLKALNNQLKTAASRDALTGLNNRRSLNEKIAEEQYRFHRYGGTPFTVVFIDLDNLRWYNQTFGHLVGDRLLKAMGKFLENNLRQADFVARFGGDEFLIILPETSIDGAVQLAQRILSGMASGVHLGVLPDLDLKAEALQEPLTCTLGIAQYDPNRSGTILEWADEALMLQKKMGGRGYRISLGEKRENPEA